mgnify:CR=1 FL=1
MSVSRSTLAFEKAEQFFLAREGRYVRNSWIMRPVEWIIITLFFIVITLGFILCALST